VYGTDTLVSTRAITASAVPEPATLALLARGFLGAGLTRGLAGHRYTTHEQKPRTQRGLCFSRTGRVIESRELKDYFAPAARCARSHRASAPCVSSTEYRDEDARRVLSVELRVCRKRIAKRLRDWLGLLRHRRRSILGFILQSTRR